MTIADVSSVARGHKLVLGLNGTPRIGGNSEVLLDQALAGAVEAGAQVMRFDVARMAISGCRACGSCGDSGVCVVKDDMTQIFDLLERGDAMIIASPLYFSGLSSQLKAAIDRCQCLWAAGPSRLGRPAAFICVGGDLNANFKNASSEARSFMKGIGYESRAEMLVPGLDRLGAVSGIPELMTRARQIGRDVATMA